MTCSRVSLWDSCSRGGSCPLGRDALPRTSGLSTPSGLAPPALSTVRLALPDATSLCLKARLWEASSGATSSLLLARPLCLPPQHLLSTQAFPWRPVIVPHMSCPGRVTLMPRKPSSSRSAATTPHATQCGKMALAVMFQGFMESRITEGGTFDGRVSASAGKPRRRR